MPQVPQQLWLYHRVVANVINVTATAGAAAASTTGWGPLGVALGAVLIFFHIPTPLVECLLRVTLFDSRVPYQGLKPWIQQSSLTLTANTLQRISCESVHSQLCQLQYN